MSTRAAYLLLDRSGSMSSCEAPVVAGINDFIAKLQSDPTGRDARFLLTTFDSQGFDIIRRGDMLDIKPLASGEFQPRALTPLMDAAAHAISDLDEAGADKNMLIIMTDGLENASKKSTSTQVKALIEDRRAKGWIIIYLAAHVDAWQQAAEIGVPKEQAMNFRAGTVETPRRGPLGWLGAKVQSNPVSSALIAAAGIGAAYYMLSGSAVHAAASSFGFKESDRNEAMGVDGTSQTWRQAVQADVDGFDEPCGGIFDLPADVAAAEGTLPADFDPSLGSIGEDGAQPGQTDHDVLTEDDRPDGGGVEANAAESDDDDDDQSSTGDDSTSSGSLFDAASDNSNTITRGTVATYSHTNDDRGSSSSRTGSDDRSPPQSSGGGWFSGGSDSGSSDNGSSGGSDD